MTRLSAAQVAYLRRVKAAEPESYACKGRGAPEAHGLYLAGLVAIARDEAVPGLFHVLTPRARAHLAMLDRAAAIEGAIKAGLEAGLAPV